MNTEQMSIEEIRAIINGTLATLNLLQNQAEYQKIETDYNFETELTLVDAIQILKEISKQLKKY
jgi:hypothetical protein